MTAPQATVKLGGRLRAKPAPNKKLFAVLGVVILLALGMRLLPSLVGGGAAKPFHPTSLLHLHKPVTPAASSGQATGLSVPARDPFAPPVAAAPAH